MMNLPEKKSQKWFLLIALVFATNLIGLLLTRILVGQSLTVEALIGFGLISIVISLFLLPGYLGSSAYAFSVLLGDTTGLAYMYYLILARKNDGWVDLTSIFAFLSLVVIGIGAGIIAQFILWILHKK